MTNRGKTGWGSLMRRLGWVFLIALMVVLGTERVWAGDAPIWTFRGPGGTYGIGSISGETLFYLGPTHLVIPLSPKKFAALASGIFILAFAACAFRALAGPRPWGRETTDP